MAVALLSRCHDEIDPGPRRPQPTAEQHQWAEPADRTNYGGSEGNLTGGGSPTGCFALQADAVCYREHYSAG